MSLQKAPISFGIICHQKKHGENIQQQDLSLEIFYRIYST